MSLITGKIKVFLFPPFSIVVQIANMHNSNNFNKDTHFSAVDTQSDLSEYLNVKKKFEFLSTGRTLNLTM